MTPGVHAHRRALIALLAAAMGAQNAMVQRLAVPDLTTTVLTLTVTGLFADSTPNAIRIRRIEAVLAMLGGAALGGALLRWVAISAPLWVAASIRLLCGVASLAAVRRPGSDTWH
jgi:uncharacterized membrane protein YoaK (UPF0700 family)